MRELRIVLPWPSSKLSPNARGNWAQKHRYTKAARSDAAIAAMAAMREQGWITADNAITSITYYSPDADWRKRDRDNFLAILKPHFDGMADVGVIANDSGFTHHPVRFVRDANKRVEVVVASE
jgi:Holliday junction resolvase RusA-like endonuclease